MADNYEPGKYRNFGHSRAKAIAAQCYECSGFSCSERRKCPAKGCALWAFRMGYEVDENDEPRYPSHKRTSTLNFEPESDFVDEDDEILDLDEEIDSTEK